MTEVISVQGTDDGQVSSGRRKICLVGPGFHFLGGLSVYTCRLANALNENHEVSVLLLHKLLPTRLYPGGHRAGHDLTSLRYHHDVRKVGDLNWYWGTQMCRAMAYLRRERPEILVLQWWTAAALHSYLALAIAARRLRIPVVLEFHETQDPGEAEVPLMAAYCRRFVPRLLALASGALVHNEHDLALLKATYGSAPIERLAVEIAPHGPYDHLADIAGQPEADAEQGPAGAGVTRLLFFGLIRPYKGVEDLVSAFNGLTHEQASKFTLTVVGETWEDWDLPARLIEDSPHRDRITFVNRYVSDAEASAFFAEADAIVLPYRRGSASGPLQIAMSAGLHVVLYAVGGLVDAVKDYRGAVLVTPSDTGALQSALLDLVGRAEERFEDPHSWAATGAALERVAAALSSAS
ncbi:glycosyltransferase involved in cell wall biosynthesis [Nakamurella sp. UYEF19]|uniref:glycosyltransferase n=1 Tax=Nakamurella sp. UYEF19 TaxID=1756392 RepID=UPI0033973E29